MLNKIRRPALAGLASLAAVSAGLVGAQQAAAAQTITINYWGFVEGITGVTATAAIKSFEAEHPNVKIQTLVMNTDDIDVKLPSAMASGSGPDIVYSGSDPATLGRYVKLGQVLSLGSVWDKYGWNKMLPSATSRVSYNGQPDAVPNELETLGLMYNPKIFAKVGISVPTTLQQLEQDMATIKAKDPGVTPMILACGGPCYNGLHMMHALGYATIPTKTILATTVNGKGSYLAPAWKNMLTTFATWEKDGYFSTDPNGIPDANHVTPLCDGKAAMMAEGTWFFSTMAACAAANPKVFSFGFAPFPVSKGLPFQVYDGPGKSWFFNKSLQSDPAKEKLALEFVASMTTPKAATSWVNKDQLFPAYPFAGSSVHLTPQQVTALKLVKTAGKSGGGVDIGFNNSPAETNVWVSALQGIIAGSETPSQAVSALESQLKQDQKAWDEGQG